MPKEPPESPSDSASSKHRNDVADSAGRSSLIRPVLYPNVYVWYVLLASLDVMLTCAVLWAGGRELNTLADRVIDRWGLPGLVTFKFLLVLFVVGICEVVGRRNDRTGRRLAEWAVAITAIPVVLSLLQLFLHMYGAEQH